jgi:hypothetical protein
MYLYAVRCFVKKPFPIFWYIGILTMAAGVVSFGLRILLLGLVALFEEAIGFLLWIEGLVGVGIETAIHVRHLYKEAREVQKEATEAVNPPEATP